MTSGTSRRNLLQTTALAGALALSIAGTAVAQERVYNIPSQPLANSLRDYGIASGEQIIFAEGIVQGRQAPALQGAYESGQALAMLLAGTDLIAERTATGGVMIRKADQDPQGGRAAGRGASTVEALIVTAQKREEDIQDVPIAISAFSQEDLTRSQVAGGPDLMTQVPNMTFTKTNFSSYSIQIRGIGTQAISATTDPAVAVAFNNTPFVRNRFFEQEFYDLQRVEVLRGPQGTLYGRNATAGVVNIISAKPKFIYEARASGDVGNYNSTRIEGMINLPLVEDAVSLRLAGAWTKREGYSTNELTGSPIDGRDLWSTRVSLRFAPTDRIEANLIWEHFEEDDDRLRSGKQLCEKHIVTEVGGVPIPGTPERYGGTFPGSQSTYYQSQLSQGCEPASLYSPDSFQTPNGFQLGFYHPLGAIGLPKNRAAFDGVDPYVNAFQSRDLRVIESMVDPIYKAKNDTFELQVNVDLSEQLSLTSETAWASDMVWSMQDYNRFNTQPGVWADTNARPGVLNDGVFCDPQIGCSDRLITIDLSTADTTQFSQEFRLGSDYDSAFNFSLGANFMRLDSMDKYYVFSNAFNLWAASNFASRISTPYIGGVSDNRECLPRGMEPISLDDGGGVGVSGACRWIDPNPLESITDIGHTYFLSKNPYKLISYAVFGEAYYNVAENLKVTAGLRWTVDKKEAPRIPSWVLATGVGYPVAENVRQEWREPTGRLTVDWKPDLAFTDETLLYASYAHGYKAGGANPPIAGVALNAPSVLRAIAHRKTFDAEFVDAYEIGSKNTLFDGRMTLNVGAFYYDYTGYQISQIVDRSALNLNFDAEVWGAELEADWRPAENLRFGLKLGYADTKVGDGEKAIDVMDRSDGNRVGYLPDGTEFRWIVVKPFPIYPSNCVMPDFLWLRGTSGDPNNIQVHQVGNPAGSADGPCDVSYYRGLDIFTMQQYEPFPSGGPSWSNGGFGAYYPNYPGFDPASAPNNGDGFEKDLSGNELPNTPHYTATLTADYTVPLAGDWLATLHTDLYYQSEAWTRIFNTEGYDKLKAYTNVNLAAIFTNDMAGWKVMAYVKNVMNRDSITGAFLNSDDTGLTTNVFLTEPRLYGLRVTKEWTGGPWWTGANPNHSGPFPLTVEIGGQVQTRDAPYESVAPSFRDAFSDTLDTLGNTQHRDFDTGDGRQVKLTYRPTGSLWNISAGVRYGKANTETSRANAQELGDPGCAFPLDSPFAKYCGPEYADDPYFAGVNKYLTNWSDTTARSREDHLMADFAVGRDVGLGLVDGHSAVGLGARYGEFNSKTNVTMNGIPDWDIADGWFFGYPSTHTRYEAELEAHREFSGLGPMLSWDAAVRMFGNEQTGHISLDWTISGGALFGKQTTSITGEERYGDFNGDLGNRPHDFALLPDEMVATPVNIHREDSVTVPVLDLSLGLSYEIQRVKIGAGYRWERYFDVLDVGFDEAKDADRTIDGPYLKLSVGFGGS